MQRMKIKKRKEKKGKKNAMQIKSKRG